MMRTRDHGDDVNKLGMDALANAGIRGGCWRKGMDILPRGSMGE